MSFKVAIIGRPNVGKSTLFNRLCGKKASIVHDQPGVTRDWIEHPASLGHLQFIVIDTPGLSESREESIEARMNDKAREAAKHADIILFMVDGRTGFMPEDKVFANHIRKFARPVVLVANKCERQQDVEDSEANFARLGFGEPVCISAAHNHGMAELIGALESKLEKLEDNGEEEKERGAEPPIQVAFVGRPNAGKSTLVNAILGENRLLTGAEPGITRDSVNIEWSHAGRNFRLVDTAGLRKRSKVEDSLEKLSNSSSINSIRFAQVVVVVVDATHPLEKQDLTIADLAEREGRAVVIVCNKADLVPDKAGYQKAIRKYAEKTLPQLKDLPIVLLSATRKENLKGLLDAINQMYDVWNRRIPTAALNRWLDEAIIRNAPPMVKGKRIRLKFASQSKSRPPTIVFFSNIPEKLPGTYERYLVNDFRDCFDMPGTPVRIILRKQKNPYDNE